MFFFFLTQWFFSNKLGVELFFLRGGAPGGVTNQWFFRSWILMIFRRSRRGEGSKKNIKIKLDFANIILFF